MAAQASRARDTIRRGTRSLLARWAGARESASVPERYRDAGSRRRTHSVERRRRTSGRNTASGHSARLTHRCTAPVRDRRPDPFTGQRGPDRAAVAVGADPGDEHALRTCRPRRSAAPAASARASGSSGGCTGSLAWPSARWSARYTSRAPPGRRAPLDQRAERAERGRELVERELRVLGRGARADRGAAGLDVDDDGPPGGVDLQPVDPAAQPQARDTAPRRDLVDQVELHGLLDRDQPQALGPAGAHPAVERRRACRAPGRARGGRTTGRPRRAAPRPSAGAAPARRCPPPPPRPGPVRAPSEPVTAASAPTSLPPCRSNTQRSGQRMIFSTSEGDTGHDASAGRSGASVDTGAAPYQSSGWAPGMPASASRASWAAARARARRRSRCGPARRARRRPGAARRPARRARARGQAGATGRSAWSGGQRVELVEEARGLLVLALDRADQQRVPGPGARDVEQPAFLGEQRRDPRHGGAGGLGDPGDEVDEPLVAQQAAAQPQVRPGALLDAGHGDDVPLAPAGGVRREQLDGVAARGAGGQRVARELLVGEVFDEGGDVGAGQPVGDAGRRRRRARARRRDRGRRQRRPGRRGRWRRSSAGRARRPARPARAPPRRSRPRGRRHPRRQQGADPAQRGGLVGGQRGERIGPPAPRPPAGPRPAAGRSRPARPRPGGTCGPSPSASPGGRPTCIRGAPRCFAAAPSSRAAGSPAAPCAAGAAGSARTGRLQAQQAAAQAAHPHRVRRAERGGEQRRGGVGIQLVRADGVAEHHQQRHDRGLAGERQLVGRRGDRHARGQQRAPQRRERAPGRAREHRHPRPRHTADEMRAPQLVGDPARLLRRG